MAIQFARCEYVSRSSGGNACRKASYNQRDVVPCERTGEVFSFKEREGNIHHEVLLPTGADARFKNSTAIWNEAENCEKRKDSQVAKEFVIALPDDTQVTLEDRIELSRRFATIFVERGVAVQLDVHAPHDGEKNWHAHLLVTTRRFAEDGLTFFSKKATDLDPVIRSKVVVEADLWGEIWRDLQNTYFEERGYDLRVDPIGIIPQEHLGPVRMRHHLNEAIARSQLLQKSNEKLAQDPRAVLEEMTRNRSIFSQKDVEHFLQKHVPLEERQNLLEKVLDNKSVLPLYNKDTGQKTTYFTTKHVRAEEEKLLRFADSIESRHSFALPTLLAEKVLEGKSLSDEQRAAYELCVSSAQNLCVIQGRAGVGKSYVLKAIREAHEAGCFRVLGLAPTNKVAMDLKNDGFQEAKTCHSFLFRFKNGREKLDSNTLVVVDEAGMLGTTLSVELFNVIKNSGAKLLLVGDDRQLSSVERGGTFGLLAERYGAAELREVRRQTVDWQKAVSEDLSRGNIKSAVQLLQENKAISWNTTKEEALSELLKSWGKDSLLKPQETRQIITQKNVDVDALNQGARDILRAQGKLGETEIACTTSQGRVAFAEGDRVQFTTTDKDKGLTNGFFGMIEHINLKTKILTIRLDNEEVREVDPDTYDGLRHGYAATVYKAQGATLDHVYVLHSDTTTQPTNYVALTRQTKSLGLYVSQEETPSPASLIRQMGRPIENTTSLLFDTQKDIEKRQEEKSFLGKLKHSTETFFIKAKDLFHTNVAFYQIEKPTNRNQEKAELILNKLEHRAKGETTYPNTEKSTSLSKVFSTHDPLTQEHSKEKPVRINGAQVFAELTKQCAQKLYSYLAEEKIDLTPDLIKRIDRQGERAANFIFHAHTLKGTRPTAKETKYFLLRAKYELNRIPEIRNNIIDGWQKANSYKGEKDELIAHMIAERQASIEGRMYLQAKQAGFTPLPNIPDLAAKELKSHRAQTESLSQELIQKHRLSKSAATSCAKDILRHQETHGEKPTDSQMAAMVQISKELDKQGYPASMGTHNIEYLRRRDGDMQCREMAVQGKDFSGFKNFPHAGENYSQPQARVKSDDQAKPVHQQAQEKVYAMDFSM